MSIACSCSIYMYASVAHAMISDASNVLYFRFCFPSVTSGYFSPSLGVPLSMSTLWNMSVWYKTTGLRWLLWGWLNVRSHEDSSSPPHAFPERKLHAETLLNWVARNGSTMVMRSDQEKTCPSAHMRCVVDYDVPFPVSLVCMLPTSLWNQTNFERIAGAHVFPL